MNNKDYAIMCNVMEVPSDLYFSIEYGVKGDPDNKEIRFCISRFQESERAGLTHLMTSIDGIRRLNRSKYYWKLDLDDLFINYIFIGDRQKHVVAGIKQMMRQIDIRCHVKWSGDKWYNRLINWFKSFRKS